MTLGFAPKREGTMGPLVTTEWLAGERGKPDLVLFDATMYLPNETNNGKA